MKQVNGARQIERQIRYSCIANLRGQGRKRRPNWEKIHIQAVKQSIEIHGQMEYNHSLIDYKSENAVIKQRAMTFIEAKEKNAMLRGSGFAWARVDGGAK